MNENKRYSVSVIGDSDCLVDSICYRLAYETGMLLADNRYYIVTGGLGGVMEAADKGAHASKYYEFGDTIGYLPGNHTALANQWVDRPIPTSLGHVRNAIVAQSDAIIAVGGAAGTLSEMCFAWIFDRLVVGLTCNGWSKELAGKKIDNRIRFPHIKDDCVFMASNPIEAVNLINQKLPQYLGI
ncbi:hypothetical protein KS4_03790 [Poriferisphaera corsica]|uniref:TIGR00725 family protein n=1 Tax=Poriferisphaera corsica TaxID=2528020 RepID=A0A517YQ51_9BACT|nr:acyl-CoA synthetase [Poriferisphaera corsica]QDU32347.1 hypothetical protein KS4_03790 [Poriferisphaera corsica]